MNEGPKNYEICYLLPSSLSQEEAMTVTTRITALIEESKGAIRRVEEPKKRQLAYAIKKDTNAYFGWTTFSILPEAAAVMEKQIKADARFLRIMVVEEEIERRPPSFRPFGARPPRNGEKRAAKPVVAAPREEEKEERLDLEALDKKLEEILGK